MMFKITAFVFLAFFYSVYLGKMIIQRRQGIKTDQIASKGKQGNLYITEFLMRLATYGVLIVEVVSILFNTVMLSPLFRFIGIVIAGLGNIIFAIAVYTMRDSWRAGIAEKDKTELITSGIYSISRNPAFLGFYLLYIGILLMFFNWVLCVFTVLAIIMLHLQILQEEKHLIIVFGSLYEEYRKEVKRYLGRL